MITYAVGQELWYEPRDSRYGAGRTIRVQKIGRKWASLGDKRFPDRYRVEIGQVEIDGGDFSSPGRLWINEQECRKYRELERELTALRVKLNKCQVPDGLTIEKLNEAKRLLGLE